MFYSCYRSLFVTVVVDDVDGAVVADWVVIVADVVVVVAAGGGTLMQELFSFQNRS